jgi:chromate transporter
MMEQEVGQCRQWITHEHFLDLPGATNLIPGQISVDVLMDDDR